MSSRNSVNKTGGLAAIVMILILGGMLGSLFLVWYVPNPLQAPLQTTVGGISNGINGLSGAQSQATINGVMIVTDTSNSMHTITASSNGCPSGCIIYNSAGNSGTVNIQVLANMTGSGSWTATTSMQILVDGSQVLTTSLNTQGTLPATNVAIQGQILTGSQINNFLPYTAFSSSSTHTLTVSISGTIVFSGGSSPSQSFSQSNFIQAQLAISVTPNGYVISI